MTGIFEGLRVVKEFDFHKPLLSDIDSIFDNCKRDCYYEYYHTYEMTLEYDINVTNKRNNEMYNLSISNIPIGLIALQRELK